MVRDEAREREEADEHWGYGEVEEVEVEEGRVNGEYELAARGYGDI